MSEHAPYRAGVMKNPGFAAGVSFANRQLLLLIFQGIECGFGLVIGGQSLFHFRFIGAGAAKVLVGIERSLH